MQSNVCMITSSTAYLRFYRVYANFAVVFTSAFESNFACSRCEQGIVFADAYVRARMEVRTTLANDDVAGFNDDAVMAFYTKAFGFAITAVTRGAYPFFMSEKL